MLNLNQYFQILSKNSAAQPEEFFDDSPDSSATSVIGQGMRDQGASGSGYLPIPTAENLDMILHSLSRVAMQGRDKTAEMVTSAEWLGGLIATFEKLESVHRDCKQRLKEKPDDKEIQEEMEDSNGYMTLMFQCARCLFLLSNHHLTETLLSQEMYLYIFGILEYDPEILEDRRIPHRRYLEEKVSYKKVVNFNNETVERKIHINYRLQYLKDVAMPRALDDPSFSQLCSMIMHNSMIILASILAMDSTVLEEIFTHVPESPPHLHFFHQVLALSKTMPPASIERARIYEEFEKQGKFYSVLVPYLEKTEPPKDDPTYADVHKDRSIAMDIILMSVGQNTAMARRFIAMEVRFQFIFVSVNFFHSKSKFQKQIIKISE
jgi:hypothetical protein